VWLEPLGTHAAGIFAGSAAEIPAYDARTKRVFVSSSATNAIDVISIANPAAPTLLFSIDLNPYGAGPNSVAIHRGLVAVAVEAAPRTEPGSVVFFKANLAAGDAALFSVPVGALPDMLTFSPDGRTVLVANEGEPNSYNQPDSVDPEGSVSLIDVQKRTVATAGFGAFTDAAALRNLGIRIFGPNATVAQDLEPEYIAVSEDSKTAYVTLQENNALAVIDIKSATVTALFPLGYKDHRLPGNGLDASDRDNVVNIRNWPVKGMYLPDAIAAFKVKGRTYLITANEGDARDYTGFGEEARVKGITLDPMAFPNANDLRTDPQLGRLNITTTLGQNSGGTFGELYAFGGRSFSIWSAEGRLVFDSGDQLEQLTAAVDAENFNADNEANDTFDHRSDNKGPEPEGLVVGRIHGIPYAFIGLERIGGVVVVNLADPANPEIVDYANTRDFTGDAEAGAAGDLGPEGLAFIAAHESPTKGPLLVVTNEVSGTTTVFKIGVRQNPRCD
jgi:2',3'-cyclic-nucleotide 2'-phosphodiesterase/3'-nucleotidase/5'-nucleotidase